MSYYALKTLWHERGRLAPAVFSVAFSNVLVVMALGLLLGMFAIVSLPVDRCRADLWVGHPGVPSADAGLPIPISWRSRLESTQEIARVEQYIQGMIYVPKRTGGVEMCWVCGTALDADSLGAIDDLTGQLRSRLSEPGTVVIDAIDMRHLGVAGVGDWLEMVGVRVRVVGLIRQTRGLIGSFVFCSLRTARAILRLPEDSTSFLLARCTSPHHAEVVQRQLQRYEDMTSLTRQQFSLRCQYHWLTRTRAGLAMGCSALLGLVIGAVVTSQTLYAATAASSREYAVLEALGIPSRHMVGQVLIISFWIGVIGIILSMPFLYAFARLFGYLGSDVRLPLWLVGGGAVLALTTALLSGVVALWSLRRADPLSLLR